MTLAVLPQFLIDVGAFFGVVGVVVASCAALWRTPITGPLRWLASKIAEALGDWFEARVQAANADHVEYVKYHLGPNGTTKPIHKRLCDVEEAVRGGPVPVPPFVDWNGPYGDEDDDG